LRPGDPSEASRLTHFRADLHIHTALSPCGSEEMTPPAIVAVALARGLDLIAICDHNSAGNVKAVQQAAAGRLGVLAGMEISTAEEVHLVGLFPDVAAAEQVSVIIREALFEADDHYYSFFGPQPLLDSDGTVIGTETRTLALATSLQLGDAVRLIKSAGGLAVAAHVDRHSFSVYSQLGFFPMNAAFDAIEISRHLPRQAPILDEYLALGLPITSSSDSHYLEDIGSGCTDLLCVEPTFDELSLAFAGVGGRSVCRA